MRLYGKNLKIVTAGGDLPSQVAKPMTEEGVTIDVEPVIIEETTSESPIPADRYEIGNNIKMKAVLMASTLAELKQQLNVSDSTLVVSGTRFLQLPKFDAQVEVDTETGDVETYVATDMNFSGKLSAAFKGGNDPKWYLPIELNGTASSTLTITQA